MTCICVVPVGRDSSGGIVTGYELDGPGGRDFRHPSRLALGPTQPPIHGYRFSVTGIKWPWLGVDHPPSSSAEVKERVELYLYTPLVLRDLF